MPVTIHIRNNRLSRDGRPAYSSQDIVIEEAVVAAADLRANAILPPHINSAAAVQFVGLSDIVLDFASRAKNYKRENLISVIKGIQTGVNFPPLSVTATATGYRLENGYHRFLACALLGFATIPIDKPPHVAPVAASSAPKGKYVPPHLHKKTTDL